MVCPICVVYFVTASESVSASRAVSCPYYEAFCFKGMCIVCAYGCVRADSYLHKCLCPVFCLCLCLGLWGVLAQFKGPRNRHCPLSKHVRGREWGVQARCYWITHQKH